MRLGILSALVLATGVHALAAGPGSDVDGEFPRGKVVERVTCREEASQTYALYLPSSYTPERQWPLLLLMDPRGRALLPLELFREAAEARGFIVVSSYDTRSDGPRGPNLKALGAMLPDTEARFSIDLRRHYLVGFSGTARMAWDIATLLPDTMAGIVGVGAGWPAGYAPQEELEFVFFGTAGTRDFNFEEMRALDKTLDTLGMPHRFESFEGPHSWPPAGVCARAVDWLEIQAMQRQLRPVDRQLASGFLAAEIARAGRLEEAGSLLDASHLYSKLVVDFNGLVDVTAVQARAQQLESSDEVRAAAARRAELATDHARYEARFREFMAEMQTANPPPALVRAMRVLDIKALRKRAADESDPEGALAAEQELNNVFVFMAFYLPRDFLAQSDPRRALAALSIAEAIRPGDAQICVNQARAQARMGKARKALEALGCAVDSGRVSRALLEGDPDLAGLRTEKGYDEILARLDP